VSQFSNWDLNHISPENNTAILLLEVTYLVLSYRKMYAFIHTCLYKVCLLCDLHKLLNGKSRIQITNFLYGVVIYKDVLRNASSLCLANKVMELILRWST
jgi:hypothetical protein